VGRRQGFTLLEGLMACAIAALVVGGAMLLYIQGNRAFVKTTEHASFRTEAMLLLERITRELDDMVVTHGVLADDTVHLVRPFELVEEFPLAGGGEGGETVPAGTGLRFYKFHRVDMVDAGAELTEGRPQMVARVIEYRTALRDESDPTKGMDLLRNGRRLNRIPLRLVLFRKVPREVADNQIRGSPHAILRIDVVPQGGMWERMDADVLESMAKQDKLVSRTHHLLGYESMYTAVLSNALEDLRPPNEGDPLLNPDDVLDPIEKAVYEDAYEVTSPDLLEVLENTDRNDSTFEMPPADMYRLEDELHEPASKDPFFEAAKGG
jgi:hypothetical protein